MGLSWFWFGVGLVCGLVPPLVFLLFWGSHSAPWPATKTGPLGLPGPDCTGAATMAEESSLLLWCKRCAALTNGAAATALGSWMWDLTAKLGSLLEVPKRFFDVEKETSVIKASRFCGNRRIKKPRKGWKRRLKLRCKPCLNTSLSPCYTGQPEGDLVLCGGVQFGSFDLTVNGSAYYNSTIEFPLGGSIVLGTGKGYIRSINIGSGNPAYDYCIFASGGIHRFYVGGSPFPQHLKFQLSLTQAYFNVDVVCHTELQTDVINTKNATNVDLVFKRNDVNIFKLNTSNQIQLLGGNETSFVYEEAYFDLVNYNVLRITNTENVDNGIISFGVGDVLDVFQIFKTGITSTVELSLPQVLCNSFDSFAGDNDVVFNRNGVEFFRLGTGYSTSNGAPTNLLNVDSSTGVSSGWMFANAFANRSDNTNTEFRGAISGGSGWGKFYMLYEYVDEKLHFYTDIEVDEGKKLYLNKTTSKECYIHSFVESNVKILSLVNSDTSGQNRIYCGGNLVTDMSGSVLNLRETTTVVAGATLSGELVDTSDKTKKYDIEDAECHFTEIVKQIKPKTFKLKDEKEIGTTKSHIGFVADEIESVIPKDFEHIVNKNDEGVRMLNYVKMGSITWGAVREIIKENEELKNKVEHLESRLFITHIIGLYFNFLCFLL
jgi:hypothetical protein